MKQYYTYEHKPLVAYPTCGSEVLQRLTQLKKILNVGGEAICLLVVPVKNLYGVVKAAGTDAFKVSDLYLVCPLVSAAVS